MPSNYEWQLRIRAVEREYVAMRQAADRFKDDARSDPTILKDQLRPREIILASNNLEGTYVIRLFAEFETGLRQYWDTMWTTHPKTTDLLDRLAARCEVPDRIRISVHAVRLYRNGLVHEREENVKPISIAEVRGRLCKFFSYLPEQW